MGWREDCQAAGVDLRDLSSSGTGAIGLGELPLFMPGYLQEARTASNIAELKPLGAVPLAWTEFLGIQIKNGRSIK
jgi:hypothetical protein